MHSSPERFDHCAVVAISDRSETEFEPSVAPVTRESPGRKLCRFNRSLQHGLIELTVVGRDDAAMFSAEFTNAASAIRSIDQPTASLIKTPTIAMTARNHPVEDWSEIRVWARREGVGQGARSRMRVFKKKPRQVGKKTRKPRVRAFSGKATTPSPIWATLAVAVSATP